LLDYNLSCIEQPVPHAEVNALAQLRGQIGVPIMLDESLTSSVDAERAIREELCDLFNIRLSKCGGFLSSLRLAAQAREVGLGYQLGCHPGESGILSAAGRHWAVSVCDMRYLEGSYDRHVLKKFVTKEDMTFRYGGRAPALAGPGLGVSIDTDALTQLTKSSRVFRLDC
jgi:muconate cycloisomerase